MRKTVALMGLLGLLAQPIAGTAAFAQQQQQPVAQPVYGGVEQEVRPIDRVPAGAQDVVLLPVRVVTGSIGAPIGAIGGMAKRTGDAVEMVNNATFRQVVGREENMTDNPGRTFGRGIVMVPVGVAATAAALPIGVAVGAVEGTFRGFARGFQFPNMEREAAITQHDGTALPTTGAQVQVEGQATVEGMQ